MPSQQDLKTIEDSLIMLHRATFQHKAWEHLRQASGSQLDRAEAALLKAAAFSHTRQCRLQDIARQLGVEAPSVTRTVQQLEQNGFVTREADAKDRRVSNLRLTAEGRAELAKLERARRAKLHKALAGWSAKDRATFAYLLRRLAEDLTMLANTNNLNRKEPLDRGE